VSRTREDEGSLLATARDAASYFPELDEGAPIEVMPVGLINATFAIGRDHILQRVNPIFPAIIHENIEAVTRRLIERGIQTPRLVRSRDGELCVELEDRGVWRVITRIHGENHDFIVNPEMARAAAVLVGRWHEAVADLEHEFVGMRVGVHDTPKHVRRLRDALDSHTQHPSYDQVAPLAEELLAALENLPPLPELEPQTSHGDLKFNNIIFDRDDALALIDLDTVGPMPLAHELGDMWRSWCNPAAEDQEAAAFDIGTFAASMDGYRQGRRVRFDAEQRLALLHGVEWISVELAIRFAADALLEDYFGWDAQRFPSASAHNLVRAQGQRRFHDACVSTRQARARILET
jgi:Ser/Thr protein kinase RdoA (MazF antagonist)